MPPSPANTFLWQAPERNGGWTKDEQSTTFDLLCVTTSCFGARIPKGLVANWSNGLGRPCLHDNTVPTSYDTEAEVHEPDVGRKYAEDEAAGGHHRPGDRHCATPVFVRQRACDRTWKQSSGKVENTLKNNGRKRTHLQFLLSSTQQPCPDLRSKSWTPLGT